MSGWDRVAHRRAQFFAGGARAGTVGSMADLALLFWPLPLFFGLTLAIGWTQMREGGGTVGRLAWTAARLSLLGSVPSLAAILLRAMGIDVWPGAPSLASCLALSMSVTAVNAPRLAGSKDPLPLPDDPELLARIADISQRMGIPAPRTRVAGTLGSMQALAGVFGLQAPSMLLADGILHRLAPGERDAIIAHELAHLSNGSLWLLPATISASAVAAMLLTAVDRTAIGAAGALAILPVFLGLYPLLNRRVEISCDLRAARVVGFVQMATGLDKIHAVHWLPNHGLQSILGYTVATHPPQAARYEALRARAPAGALPKRPGDMRRMRVHRLASAAMLSLWASALAAAALALRARGFWAATAILLAVLGVQLGLPIAALLVHRRKWSRRLRTPSRFPSVVQVGAALVFLAFVWSPLLRHVLARVLDRATLVSFWWRAASVPLVSFLLGAALLLVGAVLHRRRARLRGTLVSAMAQHDFTGAVAVADTYRRRVHADPELRYLVAVALLHSGQREQAILELARLCEGSAPMPAALLALSAIARGEPGLRCARRAVELLPGDVGARVVLAMALRENGQDAIAERELANARPTHLEMGHVLAVRALLACDRREWDVAVDLVRNALALAPGDAFVLRCRAEVVQHAQPDLASAALDEARAASRANPFALLEDDLNALEARLAMPASGARRMLPG